MRSLIDYINEGILNDTDTVLANGDTYMAVEEWLNNTYNISKGYGTDGTYDIIVSKNDCVVNVDGDIRMRQTRGGYNSLTNGMFRFGTINGSFYANYQNLTNLEGSPREVRSEFSIEHNMSEFTCEGGPDKVGGIKLGNNCISLEDMPQDAGSYFYCTASKLKSLKGCGKSREYHFENNEVLETTEGIPAGECIRVYLNGCKKLKSLKGLENVIPGELILTSCKALKSLEGLPTKFASRYNNSPALLNLDDLNVKSLKGISANSDWTNVIVDVCGCDKLEDISMLPKCHTLVAKFLPSLSEECYNNIKTYVIDPTNVKTQPFPMPKARKSRLRGAIYMN